MVYVDIVSMDGDKVTASYAPESKDAKRGTIELNRATGDELVVEYSPDDNAHSSWYVPHAFDELFCMLESEPPRMSGVSCWY